MNARALIPRFQLWLGALACAGIGIGCAKPGDGHLDALNKAHLAVQAGMSTLESWHADSIQTARERVDERFKDLNWLVADSTLTFQMKDGRIIGDWNRVKRFLKDGPERLKTLKAEGQKGLSQLENLANAIRNKATHDSEGTPMDEAYFADASKRELDWVEQWQAAVAETERLVGSGLALEASTRTSLDSLIRAKRAEWAQQIAGDE